MPFPLLGAALGVVARGAITRAVGSAAGRSMSASQLSRATSVAQGVTRSVRAAGAVGRLAAFSGGSANQAPSIPMDTTPHPVLRAPTMGGEVLDG